MDPEFERYVDRPYDLGLEGYCFVACWLLLELYPRGEVWRLKKAGVDGFPHAFVKVGDLTMDVLGIRSVAEMKGQFGQKLRANRTSLTKMNAYFLSPGFCTRDDAMKAKSMLAVWMRHYPRTYGFAEIHWERDSPSRPLPRLPRRPPKGIAGL